MIHQAALPDSIWTEDTGVRHKGQGCLRCAIRLAQAGHVTQWRHGWKRMLAGWSMQTTHASSSASSAGWLAARAVADAGRFSFWRVSLEAHICSRTCRKGVEFAVCSQCRMQLISCNCFKWQCVTMMHTTCLTTKAYQQCVCS